MTLDLHAPLDSVALASAESYLNTLPALESGEFFTHLYLHWAVAPFGCKFSEYNGMIDLRNGKWVMEITHNPLDNAAADSDRASHTYMRNSHAFGLAVDGMDGATTHDFGPHALQLHELEALCAAAAAACVKYDLDSLGKTDTPHPGEQVIMTHAEAAIADNYFPGDGDPDSRWDLAIFSPLPQGESLTKQMALASADLLRHRIHQYKIAILNGEHKQ